MEAEDYGAWAAVRAVGEAVTRTGSADPATVRDYLLGPEFELAGFKGRPLTFRPWDGQLRQPIPLVHARALVANAPLEGFLHQRTELDTLGVDEAETDCTTFR
jgi:ABC transporter substrate binding protein (PQQ-dependent alcohol dehydrogenase system)